MKKYAFTFSGQQTFSTAVTKHNFLLRCMPGTFPFQRSYAHKLTVTPHAALTHISDVFGNDMYTGAIDKKHTSFSFTATGFVLCSNYLIHEPLDRLYLYPTQRTGPSREMRRVLEQAPLSEDPWTRAQQLCDLTHRIITLTDTSSHTTAAEAFQHGRGSAKDLAQVLVTLCRLSGIAARTVSGLALGVTTAHCWVEVYCGSVWRALDPSTGFAVEEGYLKIAHGPDYKAVVLERGIYRDPEVASSQVLTVLVTEHVITTRDTVPHA